MMSHWFGVSPHILLSLATWKLLNRRNFELQSPWGYLGLSSDQTVKNLRAMQETCIWSLGQEDPLQKGIATHSSILAWRIPWTEKLSRLQSKELDTAEGLTLEIT